MYGVGICIPVAMLEMAIEQAMLGGNPTDLFDTTIQAFFVAALPEESFKLLALWLLLRKNPYFDEHFDGIVYAVCVGLGFAAVENVFFVVGEEGNWMGVAVNRALLAVPGHYAFAVLMGYYYSVYSGYMADGSIQTIQEGSEDYQYFYMDWYQLPKLLNQPLWTEPYNDWEEDDDEDLQTQMLVSYCKPLTDTDGRYIGTLSLDISLKWLSEQLSSVQPYPHSYVILLSRGGTYLVHPDPDKLFYETIFTRTLTQPDPALETLGKSMQNLEEGVKKLRVEGKRSYVFYTPFKNMGWSMGIVCPARDIFSGFDRLRRQVTGISLLGLLLMFLVCFRVISNTLKPLSNLASQAGNIASGHFDTVLPEYPRPDEIGTLTHSFAEMQTSLVSYIDELTRTTARRERIGGDLYDFSFQDGKLYFCVGDVSGKGIPASLFMAMARTVFRVALQKEPPVTEIAREINEAVSADNEQLMFVTMFIGVIDLKSGRMSFCNCGHNPPAILSADGKASFLEGEPNVPLGIAPGYVFRGQEVADIRGIPLFLYTDGLNEAENNAHEPFGNDRLLEVLGSAPFQGSEELVHRLKESVKDHVDGAEASDDLTMLCVRIKKS